jgi:LysR family hydrogen peroxide-inducible transcriptional activator
MNIQQLEYIIAVDSLKSFSLAAQHCHITQATLSTMIKKIEEELDIILFDRKQQPIITTDIGQEIVLQAKKAIFEIERLKEISKKGMHKIEGKLKIGIIPTIANALLPKVLAALLSSFPEVHFEFVEITTSNILFQLNQGNIDMGILATPLETEDIEESVLYYETLMVYGQKNVDKKYLIPEDIKSNKIWMLEEGHCLRNQIINYCSLRKKDLMPINLKFEANSFETLLNLVDSFGGLTLIPELYYQQLSEERKEKVSVFAPPYPVREVSLVYYRPFAKQRIIKAIGDKIKEVINPLLEWKKIKKTELEIVKI